MELRALHCDLLSGYPGANSSDAAAVDGFAHNSDSGCRTSSSRATPRALCVAYAEWITRRVIKFVENRFISSSAHLTPRDAAQPNLLEYFDFTSARGHAADAACTGDGGVARLQPLHAGEYGALSADWF